MENLIKPSQTQKSCKHDVSSSVILMLIEKYESKISDIKMLQAQPIDETMDSVINRISSDRLQTRLYERRTFIDDLRNLLTD